ncbi:MAG TPA: nuclear transport factor 2 family protein [Acidimicrobiia bacterium]|nr:nuclear transport factor 2 family protein [Acidimicrobiia bacterium]
METWELTARESIRHTIATYTYAADHGRFDDVAALFATDSVLEVHGIGGAHAEGRDEILAFFRGVGGDVRATTPPGRMQHHVASVRIEVASPQEASASSYFTVMTGAGVDHWGRYRDRLVPEGDRWLFAHRLVRTDGTTPGGWAATR